ncbi:MULTISPECIES: hypothetical protein [unclassified Myxococcus]|uniref:hypothetical protein n=1 Tax=unclassified Myxococcus TaxID=2648731 RepID=UPI001CBF82F7|nr:MULTISPECIES: hypothetical protein [unclassified Myxococcus]MBZ4399290.1 hypothetical protein [Myxococcus sp. AS-1-15]MBZ4411503.1 hypothetical protein [Myxococcus sp. XM-1-1-1]
MTTSTRELVTHQLALRLELERHLGRDPQGKLCVGPGQEGRAEVRPCLLPFPHVRADDASQQREGNHLALVQRQSGGELEPLQGHLVFEVFVEAFGLGEMALDLGTSPGGVQWQHHGHAKDNCKALPPQA